MNVVLTQSNIDMAKYSILSGAKLKFKFNAKYIVILKQCSYSNRIWQKYSARKVVLIYIIHGKIYCQTRFVFCFDLNKWKWKIYIEEHSSNSELKWQKILSET